MISQPVLYFRQNEPVYRYIEDRLNKTREAYLRMDREDRVRLLFDSATYALITANVPVSQADSGFAVFVKNRDLPADELAPKLRDAGLGHNKMKAGFIEANRSRMNLFDLADSYLGDGLTSKAQEVLMDAKGLGPAKSAFALAMLGFTDRACLDTHVCQYLGLDPKDYERSNVSEYEKMYDDAFAQIPELQGELSPFLLQWVIFDLNRGRIELHDPWFMHVLGSIDSSTTPT